MSLNLAVILKESASERPEKAALILGSTGSSVNPAVVDGFPL
jgi:hypothetical protein